MDSGRFDTINHTTQFTEEDYEKVKIDDMDMFESGIENIFECYEECLQMEGGDPDTPESKTKTSNILKKLFSPRVRSQFTRTIRTIIKTSAGVTADFVTLGLGGDIFVNSVFAISSSMSFINSVPSLVKSFSEAKSLFDQLLKINFKYRVPIFSKLRVDDGLENLKIKFNKIMVDHMTTFGADTLGKSHQYIMKMINSIITTISDWFGCLFPDTAGLASEISKSLLDYVTSHSYNLIYNVISYLSESMQKMITNTFALKKLVKHSVKYLRNLIKNMSPQQISELIQSLGVKISDLTSNSMLKGAINLGTSVVSSSVKLGLKTYNASNSFASKFSILPRAQDIIVYIIDKLILPNIETGVDLFYQLFPIYLMFSLFITNYPKLKNNLVVSDPDSGEKVDTID